MSRAILSLALLLVSCHSVIIEEDPRPEQVWGFSVSWTERELDGEEWKVTYLKRVKITRISNGLVEFVNICCDTIRRKRDMGDFKAMYDQMDQ